VKKFDSFIFYVSFSNRWKEVNDLHIKKEEMPHKTDKKTSDSDNDSDMRAKKISNRHLILSRLG
jgi:hypothetical protein